MNFLEKLLLLVLFFLVTSSSMASVNIVLDKQEIIQGAPVTGYLELVAGEGRDLLFPRRLSVLDDGISFLIIHPSGKITEISYQTYGTDVCSFFPPDAIRIPAGERLFTPLFLLFWDSSFIFEQVGEYSIIVRFATTEFTNPEFGQCKINVVEGDGQLAKWKELLPSVSSLFTSFRFGQYDKMKKNASHISDLYPPLVDQMFVYHSGQFAIPRFLRNFEGGKVIPKEKMGKIIESCALGKSLAQKTNFGQKMWEYIELSIEEYSKGRPLPRGNGTWVFR